MKTGLLILKSAIVVSLVLLAGCVQSDSSSEKMKLPGHPRILLPMGGESAIKETIASDEIWKKTHQYLLDECDKIIGTPPVERVLIGRRLLDKSREALRRIFYLSYGWRMTSEVVYLERAEKELLAISEFTDWNPSHFLDVAEMTMAAAIGYDWLYKELSKTSRMIIRDAIVEKGLKPSLVPENSGWVKATHNWNQVCNAGMTFGALAVFEDHTELADSIIDRAVLSITLPMEDYEPDGAYPEGYSYWGYGTTFNIMFLSVMETLFGSASGVEIKSGFLKTAGYLENMTGPSGDCFNYSDAGQGGGLHPAMFWFAGRLNDPSLLWSERYFLMNRKLPADRLLPAVMIWGAGITMDRITPPPSKIWAGQGKNPVALMRTSWTDPDAIYIGIKAGSPSVNHGHMDVGSFIMDAKGERWAMDFGMQNYNSLETAGVQLWGMAQNSQRWEVFRYNNFVHNTLTINSQLQFVKGYAPITSYSGDPAMLNAVSDISAVYEGQLKKAIRGVAIVDGSYVMVRDELETLPSRTTVRWNLLTSAAVTITGINSAELVSNEKKLTIRVLSPANVNMKTWSTVPKNDYDAPNPGTIMVGFEASLPADSKIVLSVLLLPEGAGENHEITSKTLSEWPVDSNK